MKSLREQLLFATLITLLVPFMITGIVGGIIVYNQKQLRIHREIQTHITMAQEILDTSIRDVSRAVQLTASRPSILAAYRRNDRDGIIKEFVTTMNEETLDWLTLMDTHGRCAICTLNPDLSGKRLTDDDPIVRMCIRNRVTVSGLQILSPAPLLKRSRTLYEKAKINPNFSGEALVIETATPILDSRSRYVGVVAGAVILNRDFAFVEKVENVLYKNLETHDTNAGLVEVYLPSICIASSRTDEKGSSRLGMPPPAPLVDNVINNSGPSIGKISVEGTSFTVGILPLINVEGRPIALMLVGAKTSTLYPYPWTTFFIFQGLVLLAFITALIVARRYANNLTRPLLNMSEKAEKIALGDYSQSLTVKSPRELRQLAESFNEMSRKLEDLIQNLEKKVARRTLEIKEMHAHMAQSEKLASTGKLAAGVAHEINNPLTAVLTNASLLAEALPEGSENREDADVIVEESLRLRKIVKGLLDFSRQNLPEKREVCLNDLIKSTLRIVGHILKKNAITVDLHLAEVLPQINLDTDQIQQVLLNLIINALDSMADGGTLTITTQADSSWITLLIADTGHGIPPDVKKKIFDPFFTTKSDGTGLGLSISYGIVKHHGGSIAVTSDEGQGTTFKLRFPL